MKGMRENTFLIKKQYRGGQQKALSNNKGFILLAISVLLSGIMLTSAGIIFTLTYKKTSLQTQEELNLHLALNSLSNYIIAGIERRQCFTSTLGVDSDCTNGNVYTVYNHPRSSDRLLMTEAAAAQLLQAERDKNAGIVDNSDLPNNVSDIRLGYFEPITLAPGTLNNPLSFPLSEAFKEFIETAQHTPPLKVSGVKVFISHTGDSTETEINIAVKIKATYELNGSAKTKTLLRVVSFFPRELGTFSLILGRNLWLYNNRLDDPNVGGDDECKPEVTGDAVIPETTTGSMAFLSPVFVNGNIHLNNDVSKLTRVSFGDKVIIAGRLKKGTDDYDPDKPGRLLSELPSIGGFLKGLFFEESDKGLEVFSGTSPCVYTGSGIAECQEGGALASIDPPQEIELPPTPGTWTQIASGNGFHCAIRDEGLRGLGDGNLYCWGRNTHGQVGDGRVGENEDQLEPKEIQVGSTLGGVTAVAAGRHHICAIKTGGDLYCWGLQNHGVLGNGQTSGNQPRPQLIEVGGTAGGVTAVAGGSSHTCAIKTGGALYCWGSKEHGKVGHGEASGDQTTPQLIQVGTTAGGVGSSDPRSKTHLCPQRGRHLLLGMGIS